MLLSTSGWKTCFIQGAYKVSSALINVLSNKMGRVQSISCFYLSISFELWWRMFLHRYIPVYILSENIPIGKDV